MENASLLERIDHNGKIALLVKKPRKFYTCSECRGVLEEGIPHYKVEYAGSGLGSIKFPARVHAGDCLYKRMGYNNEK